MTSRLVKTMRLALLLSVVLSPVLVRAMPRKIMAISQVQPSGVSEKAGAPSDSILFYDVTDIGNGATSGVFDNDPLFAVWMGFEIFQGELNDQPAGLPVGNREEFSALTVNPANGTIYAVAFDSGVPPVVDLVGDTQGDFDLYRIDYQEILADFIANDREKGTIYAPTALTTEVATEEFLQNINSPLFDGTVDGLANEIPHPSGATTIHLDGAFQKVGEPGRAQSPSSFFDYQLEFVNPETLVLMDANIGFSTPEDEDYAIKVLSRVSTTQGNATTPTPPFPSPPNQEGGYNSVSNTESWESSIAGRLALDPGSETNPAGFTLVNHDGVLGVWAADSDGGGDDIAFYEIDLDASGGPTASKKELANTLEGGIGPALAKQFSLAEDPAIDPFTNDAEVDALFVDRDGNLVIVESGFFDSEFGNTTPPLGVGGETAQEPRVITVGIESYDSPDSDSSGENEVLAAGAAGTSFDDTDPYSVSDFLPVSDGAGNDNDDAVTRSTEVAYDKSTGYVYIIDRDDGFTEDIYVFDPVTSTIVYHELNPFDIGIFNEDSAIVFTRGDINNDGMVDGDDLTALGDAVAAPTALLEEWYDLTGDGIINNDDIVELQGIIGVATTPGDFDGDGDVDGADFLEWQRSDGSPGGLTNWRDHYGTGVGTLASANAVIPEPGSLLLCLGIGSMYFIGKRNRD